MVEQNGGEVGEMEGRDSTEEELWWERMAGRRVGQEEGTLRKRSCGGREQQGEGSKGRESTGEQRKEIEGRKGEVKERRRVMVERIAEKSGKRTAGGREVVKEGKVRTKQ